MYTYIYIYIYMYIYYPSTICSPGHQHNGFMATTDALGHTRARCAQVYQLS